MLKTFSFFLFSFLLLAYCSPVEAKPLEEPIKSVVEYYILISEALAEDAYAGVPDLVHNMNQIIQEKKEAFPPALASQAQKLDQTKTIEETREELKPFSAILIAFLSKEKIEINHLHEASCPMAGANWLQSHNHKVMNPYLGNKMQNCGSFQHKF